MAANDNKRDVCNQAVVILASGRTARAGVFFDEITDEQFADYTLVSETDEADKRVMCFIYERVLKLVLEDILPDFACEHADLGQPLRINQEFGGWDYLFELPDDFLCLDKQCDEGNPLGPGYDCEVRHFKGYSHVVCGSDSQAYYCSTDHTSADDSDDGQPPDDDGNSNWTLYDEDGGLGATWAEDVAYENDSTGPMLATNALTDDAGASAYIRYVAYVQAGRSDQPQYYPQSFADAFATRLAAEFALHSKDIETAERLIQRYMVLSRPNALGVQNRHKARTRPLTAFQRRTRG